MIRHRSLASAMLVAFAACCSAALAADEKKEAVPIAVLDLDYLDTSGEPTDQVAIHERRAADFVAALRRDLSADGRYRVIPLTCRRGPCTAASPAADIEAAARAAGAK